MRLKMSPSLPLLLKLPFDLERRSTASSRSLLLIAATVRAEALASQTVNVSLTSEEFATQAQR